LYESGLNAGGDGKAAAGGIGLLSIANHPALGLGKEIRKPRKKMSVMIIGNHSAGGLRLAWRDEHGPQRVMLGPVSSKDSAVAVVLVHPRMQPFGTELCVE
jgi:hypothetical protein